MDQTRAHLQALFADAPSKHWIELRWRLGDQGMRAEFLPATRLDAVTSRIRELATGTDVYVGCAPRRRTSGRRDSVGPISTLWVDCDTARASAAAQAWNPSPTVIVASGSAGSSHAYWRLAAPLTPLQAEIANLRLATAIRADTTCHDATRILRPAGTLNHKHHPPEPVRLERYEPLRAHDSAAVLRAAPTLDQSPLERRRQPRPARDHRHDALLQIPPPVYVAELLGRTPARNGKVPCPWHRDEHPSLHVYPTPERGWCCYSCKRGGSIYDLAAAVWDMGTRDREFSKVRRRLLATFAPDLGRSL